MGSTIPGSSPDGGKKSLDLFYDDNYRELVTNLPRLGALPSSELSRLKG